MYDMKESGPASNRDYGENRHDTRQDKSYDPKLSSVYPEYWVPVQLSDVQIEQYCRTLFSKSISLSSLSRIYLEETLTSVRKVSFSSMRLCVKFPVNDGNKIRTKYINR